MNPLPCISFHTQHIDSTFFFLQVVQYGVPLLCDKHIYTQEEGTASQHVNLFLRMYNNSSLHFLVCELPRHLPLILRTLYHTKWFVAIQIQLRNVFFSRLAKSEKRVLLVASTEWTLERNCLKIEIQWVWNTKKKNEKCSSQCFHYK